jgi:membrane-bound metal-dependent hydrolase YbcI (DUF457 family)
MSLPIGHSAIGFTVYGLFYGSRLRLRLWKVPLGILLLSNLPDVDVALGIVLHGNGSAFHRGPTHSLVFALIAGYLFSTLWKSWDQSVTMSFRISLALILCHVLADSFFTNSPISFFWPLAVNWSGGYSGFRNVVDLVLFGNYQDLPVILGCAFLILLHRAIREWGAVILQKWLSYERSNT